MRFLPCTWASPYAAFSVRCCKQNASAGGSHESELIPDLSQRLKQLLFEIGFGMTELAPL